MTNEEAKLVLDNARPQTKEIDRQFYDDEDLNNAIDMAIKALEQQPSEGKVSVEVYKQVMSERDIAIEQLRELGYDFGEKIRTSEDCVSRKAMLNDITEIDNNVNMDIYTNEVREIINALPPVTPTQSWIPVSEILPKESDGVVLITVNGEVNTGRYSEFSNVWYKGDMRGVGGDDPIAWQPLPQAYREKRGNENE